MRFQPRSAIHCLLIHPRFAASGYWNYRPLCELMGAQAPFAPLGLMTVAAILPQHWEFRLVDLNVRDLTEDDWKWADLVCIGGKQPQQRSHLHLIEEAHRRDKFVVVGGPNPSAQPELFAAADCLIQGEAEHAIPRWLEAWEAGQPRGVFQGAGLPDLTQSPVPRFDLIDHRHYLQLSIQYSRGCPFVCDFCDVYLQFGREHRTKTSAQVIAELQRIYELGYRGPIDIADDNILSHRQALKDDLLPALIGWSRKRNYPFWFSTEISLNAANDLELLRLMREADFRVVFVGIETPDRALLKDVQKGQNLGLALEERVRRFQRFGMCVTSGFILGFDGEGPGVDRTLIRFIEETNIVLARAALLIALPNTQLTQRLIQEGRMTAADARLCSDAKEKYHTGFPGEEEVVDQTSLGLNFQTQRDKEAILEEFQNILATLYAPQNYMRRVRRAAAELRGPQQSRPTLRQLLQMVRAFCRLSWRMTKNPTTRWEYWRTVASILPQGSAALDHGFRLLAFYLHLETYAHTAKDFLRRRQIVERTVRYALADESNRAPTAPLAEIASAVDKPSKRLALGAKLSH